MRGWGGARRLDFTRPAGWITGIVALVALILVVMRRIGGRTPPTAAEAKPAK